MRLNFNKVLLSLVILTLFVGLSCASAAVADENSVPLQKELTMSVKFTDGTGYHWEVSPKSHDVKFVGQKNVLDNPGTFGSSGTAYFHFIKLNNNAYAKLDLISPTGEIVKSVDSDMINC